MADNYALSYQEILTKVNNKKDKKGKVEVLQRYDTNELRMFLKGAFDPKLSQMKRDNMFIQMLEGLSEEESKLLIWAKDKELNKHYKGLTSNLIREAYGWDENFMRINI